MNFPAIHAGQTLNLTGSVLIPKSIIIPAGAPVTIEGSADINFKDNGGVVGSGGLSCFQVGPGAELHIKGLKFHFNSNHCGIIKTSDDRHIPTVTGGAKAYLTGTWQNDGHLVWCEGMQEVIAKQFISTGQPNKYFVITATHPNGHLQLDNRGCASVLQQGKYEAHIRTMQLHQGEMYGLVVRGNVKQTVQIRSGDFMWLEDLDVDSLEDGWIKDPSIKNVNPLDRVDIKNCKIKALTWGDGDYGQVWRDGKRIK